MKISIKNLGPIKEAEFDFSNKFTLLCGYNSTGKTYLSYILFSVVNRNILTNLHSFSEVKKSIKNKEKIQLKKEYFDEYINKLSNIIKRNIGLTFGISEELEYSNFRNVEIKIIMSEDDYANIIKNGQLRLNEEKGPILIKEKGSEYIELNWFLLNKQDQEVKWYIVINYLWSKLLGKETIFLPVERNSIYTFKTELSLNRKNLVDQLLENKDNNKKLLELLENRSRRYPLVVSKSLDFAIDAGNIAKQKSPLYDIAVDIENDILHGQLDLDKNGEYTFKPFDSKVVLPISITSSMVKTLANLITVLKYQIAPNQYLVIDEPEMNLHPNNQIVLARVLAKIMNSGVKLIVSTHSDFIIREICCLIKAYSLNERGMNSQTTLYNNKEYTLNYKDIQVLYFDLDKNNREVKVKSLEVDENGFSIESFDETIREQNTRISELIANLESDEIPELKTLTGGMF